MRLDTYLVQNDYFESKNKAKEAILAQKIRVNNKIISKPSFDVKEAQIEVLGDIFVSRSAWKLKNYIDEYSLDVKNKTAIDIGSSTGGFSEVLLKYGAKQVVCVDVGSEQLHPKIKNNPAVEVYENQDIREFVSDIKFDLVVSDVSFISLLFLIDKIDELSNKDIVLLFKPQFEVGKNAKRNKKGVVTDERAVFGALENFKLQCKQKQWKLLHQTKSSILGKEGNEEYILHFQK